MAALMMNGEMYSCPVINFKVILEQHCVTSDGLRAFGPIVHNLLGCKDADMEGIHKYAAFKPVLKELNAKTNGIFN
jgi:hypothetical protein